MSLDPDMVLIVPKIVQEIVEKELVLVVIVVILRYNEMEIIFLKFFN